MILLHANSIEQRTINPVWIRFINQRFCRWEASNMTPRTLIHSALLMAVIAVAGVVVMGHASAAERQIPGVSLVGNDATTLPINLPVGQSRVYEFQRAIKDVLVADPQIANAVIRSSTRVFIEANKLGATNIVFFDAEGRQMARFEIMVDREVINIQNAIQKLLCPRRDTRCDADVKVESIGDGIILTGTVATQADAQRAFAMAAYFIATGSDFASSSTGSSGQGGGSGGVNISNGGNASNASSSSSASANGSNSGKVYNAIVVLGGDQVMLKVTVAEMDRQVIKQLGINLSGSVGYGTAVVNFNSTNAFPINGTPASSVSGVFKNGLTATLQAMEEAGVVRTMAEPTLTAISGESAHFLAGGMFPYPIPAALGQVPGIAFQNYGVGLNFTPVVLSGGRISLHVATEVSQLDPTNSVTVSGTTVPGLIVRRADTTAEIPSGGSLAMAGMLQDQTKQTITGFPGLMEVPILGTLFKSRDYLNNKTELVVLVTPYIQRTVAQKDLSRPDDGFADPSDPASVLLGRLNRIYGVTASPPNTAYNGRIGFILD
jgi:pilus assembly protein CpaC